MKALCSVAIVCLGQEVLGGMEGLLRLQCVSPWVSWPSFLSIPLLGLAAHSKGSQGVSHTQSLSSHKDAPGLVSHALPVVAQPPEGLILALSNFTNAPKFRASLGNWDFVSSALILAGKP